MNQGRTVFAQRTWRESLRDIETCLASFGARLYHSGICQPLAGSPLADANEKRDWRLFADFAHAPGQLPHRHHCHAGPRA